MSVILINDLLDEFVSIDEYSRNKRTITVILIDQHEVEDLEADERRIMQI